MKEIQPHMNLAIKLNLEKQVDLISGCQQGDRACQKQLYELFYSKMLFVCMRYTRDREEASGILNDAFMKVFKNLHKFKPEGALESWIRRIMVNSAIDHYRKNNKHNKNLDIDEVYDYAENEIVSDDLGVNEILNLVSKLSPGYRAVFNLYVIDGFSHKEIANKLGISEGTSKSNLSKARLKLQKMIKKLENPKYA